VENIPVRFGGAVIAVMCRVSLAPLKGPTSMYERTYLDVFERLADMVAQSAFPYPDEDVGTEEAPRVGDGVVVVDAEGRVEFASPNAMNAFHRMGIYAPPKAAASVISTLRRRRSSGRWPTAGPLSKRWNVGPT